MKEAYFFFGALVLFHFGRVAYFYYQKWQRKQAEVEIADHRWDFYLKTREQMLSIKPDDLGIELSEDTETSFAVALESHTGREVQIILIFITGEIWILNSGNAKKNIFPPKNENVVASANSTMLTAGYNYARMRRLYAAVPEPGYVKFHIITNIGVYSADSTIQDLGAETSNWQELYINIIEALEKSED
jgi:hypothetical protein